MPGWLLETGLLELFNAALFSWIVLFPMRTLWTGDSWPYTLTGLLTLDILLVEGGGYWLGKLWLLRRRHPGRGNPVARLRGLQVLYAANVALLLVFPALLAVGVATRGVGTDLPGLLLGVGLYGFGVGEFVHYFLWKINMRPAERALARRGSRRVPARFLRELRRAQANTRPAASTGAAVAVRDRPAGRSRSGPPPSR